MTAFDLALFDYTNVPNGLFHQEPPVPATCSFDISWSGPAGAGGRSPVTAPEGSTGEVVTCESTMVWSASIGSDFRFESDPEGTTTLLALLGKVRNGVFAS